MTKLDTVIRLTGAGALAFALAVAPAAFGQDETPAGEEHRHMHGHMQGDMPEGHAEMMEAHQAEMAEHMAAMEEHRAQMEAHRTRMEELIAEMNRASGDAKADAVAAVLNEMWSHHQAMGMGMAGHGMSKGHGMMKGHGMTKGHGCCMHGDGECPMMKEKKEDADATQ